MTEYTVRAARPTRQRRPGAREGSGWRVSVVLIALSIIPLVSGSLRLLELAGGPELMPDNPRVAASPAPVVVHIFGAAVYAVLGAFQFSARLRRRRPGWHRRTGRVLIGAGLAVAGSGLWMTLFYPDAPGGDLLWAVRLVASTAMAASIVLAFSAIRHRQIAAHRAWMIRAYALAVGAGTQVITQGVGQALFGTGELSTGISISSGWLVNAVIAEWIIRRPAARRRRPARARTDSRAPAPAVVRVAGEP